LTKTEVVFTGQRTVLGSSQSGVTATASPIETIRI